MLFVLKNSPEEYDETHYRQGSAVCAEHDFGFSIRITLGL
jgi:hypothetical protein